MGKSVLLEILNSPDTKNGAAHRAAPLADSPTSVNKEKTLDYLSISAPIAEARDNQEFISAAKVQQNSETTKEKRYKKEPPPL